MGSITRSWRITLMDGTIVHRAASRWWARKDGGLVLGHESYPQGAHGHTSWVSEVCFAKGYWALIEEHKR